jgi:hypothetical protein
MEKRAAGTRKRVRRNRSNEQTERAAHQAGAGRRTKEEDEGDGKGRETRAGALENSCKNSESTATPADRP